MSTAADVPFHTTAVDVRFLAGRTLDQLELEAARRALALIKNKMGSKALLELIAPEVEETDRLWEQWAHDSGGEWRVTQMEYEVEGLDLDYWLTWFYSNLDDESMQFAVHPEHYAWTRATNLFDDADPDLFCITEPMGEHLLRGFARVVDWEGSEEYADTTFPIRRGLAGYTRSGVMVARSLGHYRPTSTGFRFKLVAMKPVLVPPAMLKPNQEHGYLEYNRYMEAARHAWERDGKPVTSA